ncbi:MAG: hypothetical protein LBS09_02230 [Bacteroidales bacterium]|jgi:hypothetical protein|nr:hypothetical protein [Bacteroidales bacterium]
MSYRVAVVGDYRTGKSGIRLRVADVPVCLLAGYAVCNHSVFDVDAGMHEWLSLLMLPLYIMLRPFCADKTAKCRMAQTLLEKPVKVPSTAIREMQTEAKNVGKKFRH